MIFYCNDDEHVRSGTPADKWDDGGFSDNGYWLSVAVAEKEADTLMRASRLFALAAEELMDNERGVVFRKIKRRAMKVANSA